MRTGIEPSALSEPVSRAALSRPAATPPTRPRRRTGMRLKPAVWNIWTNQPTFSDAWTRFGSGLVRSVSARRYAERP
jgi:hypothetical protein